MARQLSYFLKSQSRFDLFLFILVFVLLGVFLTHNFDSIGQDIGRHLKTGEIIWQTKEVPKTNLFSFTEPDFQFVNHHWLSEVMFFGIFSIAGFTGLILVKTVLVFIAFLLLFITAKTNAKFWPIIISFLLSMFIFIQRTEVRPEIFSFVILSFFLFAIFKAKYPLRSNLKNSQDRILDYFWFLPILELFWVNLHIYFFIGPFLLVVFLIDQLINHRPLKKVIAILFLTLVATLINPNGIYGALLPFNILNEYGYSIVENQTLSFLASFFSFNLSIFIFKFSVAILVASFVLILKKTRQKMFEVIISVFFIYAGFKMLRNLPIYAFASFPITAFLLTDIQGYLLRFKLNRAQAFWRVSNVFKISVSAFLVFMILFIISGAYYKKSGLSKAFGFSVPNGLERAASFVKENNIEGPMFNNFDIGGYLIWRFYPEEKVFVDNRPEAYSVEFFRKVYKPMQENKEKWAEFSEKYGINFIFFGHADATSWGQAFLRNIMKNQDWQTVYINEEAIILIKNDRNNLKVVSKLSISKENAIEKIVKNIGSSNIDEVNTKLTLSRFLYNINWYEASVYFADEVIKLAPQNPHSRLYKGLVHAYYTDKSNQQLAAENIKMAIDLGLKSSQYYSILGVVYMNLGQLGEARILFTKALELDKNNKQAEEFLNKYFNK